MKLPLDMIIYRLMRAYISSSSLRRAALRVIFLLGCIGLPFTNDIYLYCPKLMWNNVIYINYAASLFRG